MWGSYRYEGAVNFADWRPDVRNWADMEAEMQATFENNSENFFSFSADGRRVELKMLSLSYEDNPPKFSTSIQDLIELAFFSQSDPPSERVSAKLLIAELRRAADWLEANVQEADVA